MERKAFKTNKASNKKRAFQKHLLTFVLVLKDFFCVFHDSFEKASSFPSPWISWWNLCLRSKRELVCTLFLSPSQIFVILSRHDLPGCFTLENNADCDWLIFVSHFDCTRVSNVCLQMVSFMSACRMHKPYSLIFNKETDWVGTLWTDKPWEFSKPVFCNLDKSQRMGARDRRHRDFRHRHRPNCQNRHWPTSTPTPVVKMFMQYLFVFLKK